MARPFEEAHRRVKAFAAVYAAARQAEAQAVPAIEPEPAPEPAPALEVPGLPSFLAIDEPEAPVVPKRKNHNRQL